MSWSVVAFLAGMLLGHLIVRTALSRRRRP
jgi:hypothetical protein